MLIRLEFYLFFFTDQATDEMVEFINSYVEEKGIKLDTRILEHLATLKPSTPSDPKHYVHLGGVLDVIYKLAQLNDAEIDKKTLDIIKRVNSVAVMKTSLAKLIKDSVEPKMGYIQKEGLKKRDPEIAKQNEKNIKNNPLNSQLQSEGFVNQVIEMIRNIKSKPEFITEIMLPILSEYGVVGQEAIQMIKIYGKGFLKSESFGVFLDSLADGLEHFSKSEGGARLVQMIPQLMEADSREKVMELFQEEAEKSWAEFSDKLTNSDMTEKTVHGVSYMVVTGVSSIQTLLKDEMKMAFANTFLISQVIMFRKLVLTYLYFIFQFVLTYFNFG